MKKIFIAVLIAAAACNIYGAGPERVAAEKTGSAINVTVGDRFFTSYICSGEEKYPYFFPVNGPVSGGSVTSMRNGLYPHHTSLFFGCDMVNGGNYWQEGLDRGQIMSRGARIVRQGGDTAIIADECIWVRPGAESPVRDFRRITITAPDALVRIIDFDISMEMLADVTILKTNHSLFSVRTAADLCVLSGGTMVNAEGIASEKNTFGIPSPWMDYYGRRGNNTEGLAIFQHPSNPWYPAPWFTRDYGFMSPTPMYWPENGTCISLKKGTILKFRYRVVVHAGDTREAGIEGKFEKYRLE